MNWQRSRRAPDGLSGARVLVVEAEPALALELATTLKQHGAVVIGPAARAAEALVLLASPRVPDLAVLDVQLLQDMAWPVADALVDCRIPFVLTTSSLQQAFPSAHATRPYLLKPVDPLELVRLLRCVCAPRPGCCGAAVPLPRPEPARRWWQPQRTRRPPSRIPRAWRLS